MKKESLNMSTRAYLIQKVDNQFKGIYLHFDGYLEQTGVILQQSYSTNQKVTQLINLGACSVLGHSTTPSEAVSHFGFDSLHSDKFRQLDIEEQQRLRENYYSQVHSIFYHRDRSEKLDIFNFSSIQEIIDDRLMIAFTYIFIHGKWWLLDDKGHLHSLEKALQYNKIEY